MKRYKIIEHLFFRFVRAGLWSDQKLIHDEWFIDSDSLIKDTDWKKMYQLAQEQSVLGIVLRGIEKLRAKNLELRVPHTLLLQWIGEVQMIEQKNKTMNIFIAELIAKLRKHDIYALLVKGQGIAQCYENPLWRSSGDVDLLLNESNYEKAKSYLIPRASFIETESISSKHIGLIIDNLIVELHGMLYFSLSFRVNEVLKKIMNETFYGGKVRSWDNCGVTIFLLGAENEAIYVFTHFLGHFYVGGVGLRQICDWCMLLWTYRDSLNHKLLEQRIKTMRLVSEWKAFGAFAVEYLGMPEGAMPMYSSDRKWKKKAEIICSFIMEVGNFGHNRDSSYYEKYPYVVRKFISFKLRCKDLLRHFRIFPIDSLRFFPSLVFNGVRSAVRGE